MAIKYKVVKVKKDEVNTFVPMIRKSIMGFGKWVECAEWKATEKKLSEERFLGLDPDTTLVAARKFVDARNPNIKNRFYNE